MATSCTDNTHPYYQELSKIESLAGYVKFFRENDCQRMKHVSLGEALDFVSGGGMNYVAWGLSVKGMVQFIDDWMKAQEPRVEYERIPDPKIKGVYTVKEKSREFGYLWNKFHRTEKEELPYIKHEKCPRDKHHSGILVDMGGITRCSHLKTEKMRPSFIEELREYFDEFSMMKRTVFHEDKPLDPSYQDDEDEIRGPEPEHSLFLEREKLWDNEEQTVDVRDPCYAIISDKGNYLPLEVVLSRISVGRESSNQIAFPFSGFTIANFVASWYAQPGKRQLFQPESQKDHYRVILNFNFVSSDD
jgi:hypothetical protein